MQVSPTKEYSDPNGSYKTNTKVSPSGKETKPANYRTRGLAIHILTDLMMIFTFANSLLMFLSKKGMFSFLCISPYSGNYTFLEYLLANAGLFALPAWFYGYHLIRANNHHEPSKGFGTFAAGTTFIAVVISAFSTLSNSTYEETSCFMITLLSLLLSLLAIVIISLILLTNNKMKSKPKKEDKKEENLKSSQFPERSESMRTSTTEHFTQTVSSVPLTTPIVSALSRVKKTQFLEPSALNIQKSKTNENFGKKQKKKKNTLKDTSSDSSSEEDSLCDIITEGFEKCSRKKKRRRRFKHHRASPSICACPPVCMGRCTPPMTVYPTPCMGVCPSMCQSPAPTDVCGGYFRCSNKLKKDHLSVKASYERLMRKYGIQLPSYECYYEEKHGDFRNSCASGCHYKEPLRIKCLCQKKICQKINKKKTSSSSSNDIRHFKRRTRV